MHWFRAKRPQVSWLALLALALQLAITFGHVHLGKAANGAPAVLAEQASHSGTPDGTGPDDDDGCAICAIAGLSASLVVPAAPALVFIGAQYPAFFDDAAAPLISVHRRGAFQARGPPV